ncbi:MAG: hypothetical protein AAB966_03030 [Patescibacteria group bacterium]
MSRKIPVAAQYIPKLYKDEFSYSELRSNRIVQFCTTLMSIIEADEMISHFFRAILVILNDIKIDYETRIRGCGRFFSNYVANFEQILENVEKKIVILQYMIETYTDSSE